MDYILMFEDGSFGYLSHSTLSEEELEKRHYAFPDQRKFPLPDRSHVLSAIRFFNYVAPKDEKTLANAILKRMEELGMEHVNVGDSNRFKKYYDENGYLAHHGIKGQKWGVWNEETKDRYTGSKSKGKRFAEAMKQDMKFNIGAGIGSAAGISISTQNPIAGAIAGSSVLLGMSLYDVMDNGSRIALGKKTVKEMMDDSLEEKRKRQ